MNKSAGVVFKVQYNDGGATVGGIGYRGVCSDATIIHNVRTRKATNCAGGTPCSRFVELGAKPRDRPREPASRTEAWCAEALLLKQPWEFSAGLYHRGAKQGQPIPMRGGEAGDIAILTTRLPGTAEAERCVFAIFRVGEHRESPAHWLVSDRSMDIQIPDELLTSVRYWDYAGGHPDWRTGLFRYLEPEAVERLVSEVTYMLGDRDDRNVILKALPDLRPTPPRRGAARGVGEGPAHKELKARIAQDPTLIGLPANARATVEHTFLSGDRVDIAFVISEKQHAVVEVETYFAEPGAHQAIKYRALMEAQLRVPLGSGRVEAVLAAHVFDEQTRSFARQYGVRCVVVPV